MYMIESKYNACIVITIIANNVPFVLLCFFNSTLVFFFLISWMEAEIDFIPLREALFIGLHGVFGERFLPFTNSYPLYWFREKISLG